MITCHPSKPLYLLDPMEWADPEQLSALQLQRLRHTLYNAWDRILPFQKACQRAAIHPDDLQTLPDLAHFPFISKNDLRLHYPNGLFAVPMERILRLHTSSGQTGTPTITGYTRTDLEIWTRLMARSLRTAGVRQGMRVQVSFGYGPFTGGLGAHYGAEALGCTVIPASGGNTRRQIHFIQDLKPDIIMATPSYMLVIADEMERQGINPRKSSMKMGILGAEPWTEEMRCAIEERFDLKAIDIYGLSEIMGPGVAIESPNSRGSLHIWEDYFYPEIIDPDTGAVLPDGSFGELVLTTLTREAMPLIRYRTHDLTRLLPGTGRGLRRMERTAGRSDAMLTIQGVKVLPTQVEAIILRDPRLAPVYQLVIRRKGHKDYLEIKTELRSGLHDKDVQTAARTDLAHCIKRTLGVPAKITIAHENTIERSSGKARRIIDLRPTQH
ncbi:AMP-binding protein [Haematospirillum sp. 15-248]|uniref:phenylacetate--CoA ligase family protein n=1 Tax=Haematospirillum sp. 15-248 TaxID=2723107 RepID=UPI00143A6159|nr:AMP-binding protein [Haematospirillum sp. 15-248]NKD87149.1 AMP-binding protein [Haematospirillum sp. 15-248]